MKKFFIIFFFCPFLVFAQSGYINVLAHVDSLVTSASQYRLRIYSSVISISSYTFHAGEEQDISFPSVYVPDTNNVVLVCSWATSGGTPVSWGGTNSVHASWNGSQYEFKYYFFGASCFSNLTFTVYNSTPVVQQYYEALTTWGSIFSSDYSYPVGYVNVYPGQVGTVSQIWPCSDLPNVILVRGMPLNPSGGYGGGTGYYGGGGTSLGGGGGAPSDPNASVSPGPPVSDNGGGGFPGYDPTNTDNVGTNSPIVWQNSTNDSQAGFDAVVWSINNQSQQQHADASLLDDLQQKIIDSLNAQLNGYGTNTAAYLLGTSNDIVYLNTSLTNQDWKDTQFLSNVLRGGIYVTNFATSSNSLVISNLAVTITNFPDYSNVLAGIYSNTLFLTDSQGFDTNGTELTGDETNSYDLHISQITNYDDAVAAANDAFTKSGLADQESSFQTFVDSITGVSQDDITSVGDMTYHFAYGTLDFNPLHYDWCANLFAVMKQFLTWILAYIYLLRCLDDLDNAQRDLARTASIVRQGGTK